MRTRGDKVYRTPAQRRRLKESQAKSRRTRKCNNRSTQDELVFRNVSFSASFPDSTTLSFEKHYITRSNLKGFADIVAFVLSSLPKEQADMLFNAFKPSSATK